MSCFLPLHSRQSEGGAQGAELKFLETVHMKCNRALGESRAGKRGAEEDAPHCQAPRCHMAETNAGG